MNRLYAVEGVYSLTGAMADHRLRLESRQIAPFLAALAARLAPPDAGAASLAGAGVPGVDPRWIDALAKDLLANRGKGLIVAGERQPAAVHAAVCALNTYLGNTGTTVSYYETKDAVLPSVSSLAALVSAMKRGHGPDARRPGRQSGVRCSRRSRLRLGPGEGPAVDRARALGRRNIGQDDLAPSPRALPRIVGRRARGRRPAQRRPAADPPPVRWTDADRSARADGRGQGSSRLRHRAGDLDADPGRGRVRHEVEPRPARWLPCRQRASRSRPNAHRGALGGARARDRRQARGAAPGGSRSGLEVVFLPSAFASRRPLRQRRVAAGASRSPHQADLGQSRAGEPEDRRDARSFERGLWSVSTMRAARSSSPSGSSPEWRTAWSR